MGLMDIFRRKAAAGDDRAPRAAVQTGGTLITNPDQLDRYLRGEGDAGIIVTPETALRVATVFRAVSLISGAVGTMPLALKRRVDARTREDASDHPLWAVLKRKPNRWMTPSAFRRMAQAHMLLRGNAYALIVRGARGNVLELLPLHPDRVKVEQLADLSLAYTYTRKTGGQIVIPQEDMLHLIGLTLDGVRGVSVIEYARNSVTLALNTEQHGVNVFKNGTSIGNVLIHPNRLGEEAVQSLKASLEAYRGSENSGKTLILEEGMDFKPLGMTNEDAQFLETRQFSRSDIAMFFGVPPHMLGDTEKSTSWGSGIEQQSIGFVTYTLEDWLTTWEETISRDLIKEPDIFAKFNRAGLVRGDIKTRYSAYAVGRQWGWLSANDVRELEDLNPIDGGDSYLEPLNMAPMGQADNNGGRDEPKPDAGN